MYWNTPPELVTRTIDELRTEAWKLAEQLRDPAAKLDGFRITRSDTPGNPIQDIREPNQEIEWYNLAIDRLLRERKSVYRTRRT